ncbi:MAG: HAD-IB family hydrolase [Bacteroidales bacterium]|nr:HAD-IB family hydrolase [Bacteroidales bacterium]
MKKRFKYIAFYDLDHTILVVNSATHLVEEARNRGIMTEKQYRQAVYLSIIYKLGLGNPTKMIARMLSWLKDLQLETITNLCYEVFDDALVQSIRPEILESITEHRSRNGANVLLSSATTPICQPVTSHLELDDMICTNLRTDNGILTGTTEGKLVYGKEKKNRLFSYCQTHGYDPAESYYYGDSFTDRYVMESVGNPVAVAPDRKLQKIALDKNWRILVGDR